MPNDRAVNQQMTTELPAGVPELSGDEAIDMGRHLDPVSAAYALGARRGYEAGLEAAAKVCDEVHDDEDFEDDLKAMYCAKAIRNRKGKQ